MRRHTVCHALAALFDYPAADYAARLERAAAALADGCPQAAERLEEFRAATRSSATEDFQELFIQTFDLNPACALEVGWHLFGEQYERGALLVKMRQQMQRFGLREGAELPDHLMHALAVLAAMEPAEADAFAAACLFPALDKMRQALRGRSNPFEHVLEALVLALERFHPRPPPQPSPAASPLPVLQERSWR